MSSKSRTWIYVAVGAITFFILHLHFLHAWDAYYVHFPWEGHKRTGPAFFSSSTLSFLITNIVLFTLPLFALWFTAGRDFIESFLGLWGGVVLSAILIEDSTYEESNLGPIIWMMISAETILPIFFGAVVARVLWRRYGIRRMPTGE